MSNETSPSGRWGLREGIRLYREQDFGAAILFFDKAKATPLLTNEMKEVALIGFLFAGRIARDHFGKPDAALRDLHEAYKIAVELDSEQRKAEIADDIKKSYAVRDEKLPKRKK